MSGMIMLRGENGIVVASDGGCYVSPQDFTITGFMSKPEPFPQLSAVVCMCGSTSLSALLRLNHESSWVTFEMMVEKFREQIVEEVYNCFRFEPLREELMAVFFVGGYSPTRSRWESYQLLVDTRDSSLEDGVGDLVPGQQCMTIPGLTGDTLLQYGLDQSDIKIDWMEPEPALIAMMRSMRASPHYQGNYGEEASEANRAAIIGGFVEVVRVYRDMVLQKIVWRWPDQVGDRINISDEGEPTYWGIPHDDTQA